MQTLRSILTEILQRVIRTESRIVQLGDHVGANLRSKQRIDVYQNGAGTAVEIDALDVSFSRIVAELKDYDQGVVPITYPVPVYLGAKLVARIERP